MKTETATLTMRKTDKSGATSYAICGRSVYVNKGVFVGDTMPPTLELIVPVGFALAGPAEPKAPAPRVPLTPAQKVEAAKAALAAAEKAAAAAAVATPPAPKTPKAPKAKK